MNGLDKIISQILDDADKEAKEILAKADTEADAVLAAAREDVKKLEEEAAQAATRRSVSHMERVKSSADLKKRQAVLEAKQQVISSMLDRAYEKLLARETGEYFDLIEQMIGRFALARQGEIYFSQKDLDRMPDGFASVIENRAAAAGGSLTLMKEPKKMDGGFILVYGGVEENCTFRALFAGQRDALADKVHEMVFS